MGSSSMQGAIGVSPGVSRGCQRFGAMAGAAVPFTLS